MPRDVDLMDFRERYGLHVLRTARRQQVGFLLLCLIMTIFGACLIILDFVFAELIGYDLFPTGLLGIALAVAGVMAGTPVARGDMYSALLANSRTLAVKGGRGRVRRVKRSAIVACDESGRILIDNRGRRYLLACWNPFVSGVALEFRDELFDRWWPDVTDFTIRQHAWASGPTLARKLAAMCVWSLLFVPPLLAVIYWRDSALFVTAITVATAPFWGRFIVRIDLDGSRAYQYPLTVSLEHTEPTVDERSEMPTT